MDALLSGHYFREIGVVRVRLDLTSLRNGNLIGSAEVLIEDALIPSSISIMPEANASEKARSLAGFFHDAQSFQNKDTDTLAVSLSTGRGNGAAYLDGEELTIFVMTNQDCYLKLYHIDVQGSTQLIWPNSFSGTDGRVAAHSPIVIPGPSDAFRFRLGAPYGTEFIKAVASTEPFDTLESDFQNLGTDSRAVISRGLEQKMEPDASATETAEALASYVILGQF